jgi:hypothetical protein
MTYYGFQLVSLMLILSVVLPAAFGLQSPPDPPATDPLPLPDTAAPPEPPAAKTTPTPESQPLPKPGPLELPASDPAAPTPPASDPFSAPAATKLGERLLPDSTEPQAESNRELRNQYLIIAWSESGDELRGFSTKLGDWDLLKIDSQLEIEPVLGSQVAAVRVGNKLAAFSAEKGWWDIVNLSTDWTGDFYSSGEVVTTRDNGHLYTFAAQKGRWTSPTDPEYQKQRQQIAVDGLRPNSQFVQKWIESLPRYEARGVTAQFGRSGLEVETDRLSLMSRAKAELESKLAREVPGAPAAVAFPGPPVTSVRTFSTGPAPAIAATPAVPGVSGVATALPPATFFPADPNVVTTVPGMPIAPRIAIARDPQIQQLRSELDAINAEVEQMASQSPEESLSEDALRPFVEKSFDLRQDLQQLEAQRLRTKLQEIEKALEERQQNRDKLIEQRVKELTTAGSRTLSQSKISLFSSDAIPKTVIGKPALFAPSKPVQPTPRLSDKAPKLKVIPALELEFRLLDLEQEKELHSEVRRRRNKQLDEITREMAALKEKGLLDSENRMLQRRREAEEALQAADQAAKEALSDWRECLSQYEDILRRHGTDLEPARTALEAARKRLKEVSANGSEPIEDVSDPKVQSEPKTEPLRY